MRSQIKTVISLIILFSFSHVFAATDVKLKAELIEMLRIDQDVRQQQIEAKTKEEEAKASDNMEKIDLKNQSKMKAIIKQYGWPTSDLVDSDGVNAAFILVQHASDKSFQKEMLPFIKKAFEANEGIDGEALALLTDRVRVRHGEKQVYGTQAKQENGEMVFLPIEDQANVDKRRESMGMSTLAHYKKLLEELYGLKDHPDIEIN